MKKIRLAYRWVIEASAVTTWDRYVFETTYKEYQLQHQLFNTQENPCITFRELLALNEKAAQLHFLVGAAAEGYVAQLKGKLPHVTDELGKHCFPFTGYELDIINTNISDRNQHKIGMTFYSPLVQLLDIVNQSYWISLDTEKDHHLETFLFPFRKGLTICYYEK